MRPIHPRTWLIAIPILLITSGLLAKSLSPSIIACRVIESKTDKTTGVTFLIFHQDNNADRSELGAFLRNHDGATVEFQAANGSWQTASVFRLKSCFGRGLLVLARDQARLVEGARFLLRSSSASGG